MNDKKFALATEGRHLSQLTDISVRPTKKGDRQIANIRFSLHDEKASATLWICLGKDIETLLASVLGYEGTTLDPIQLLGRTAEVDIVHGTGDTGTVYANVKPATVKWENEPTPPVETADDPTRRTILVTATHPKPGTYSTASYFFRVIGNPKVFLREVPGCKSGFDAAKTGVFDLLASAKQKRVTLRILIDQKPLATAQDVLDQIGNSSIQWMRGDELKRRLFRRLPRLDPQHKKFPASARPEPPASTDADWIEALG
jgi:hypothetical protein